MSPDSELYCVDPLKIDSSEGNADHYSKHQLFTDDDVYEKFTNYVATYGKNKNIRLIREFSDDAITQVPRVIDFLFIDANESYISVFKDLNNYGPLIAPGGIIAIHDVWIKPNPYEWMEPRPMLMPNVEYVEGPKKAVLEFLSGNSEFTLFEYTMSLFIIKKKFAVIN